MDGQTHSRPKLSEEILKKADIHVEGSKISVTAGISNLRIGYKNKHCAMLIKFKITVPTLDHRAVHMSRLVAAAQRHLESDRIEDSMRKICKEIDETQPGCKISCEFEYSFGDQFMSIEIERAATDPISYRFSRIGITACPCSKKLVDIGHMQRTMLTLEIKSKKIIDFDLAASKMGDCFSTTPKEYLKREDEAAKILMAQDKALFVEDVVRETLNKFPEANSINVQSFESIHTHDAIAQWRKKEEH